MSLFRSRAALLDELAGLRVQHTACLAELLCERRRADRAEGNLAVLTADMLVLKPAQHVNADERTS